MITLPITWQYFSPMYPKFDLSITLRDNSEETYAYLTKMPPMVPQLARAVSWSRGRAYGAGSPTDRRTRLLSL